MTHPIPWHEPRVEMCLVLVRRDVDGAPHLLLGEKLRGFGQGRVVAPGGKIDPGETPVEAAARELFEETGLRVHADDLHCAGEVTFVFPYKHTWDQRAHVYVTTDVTGEAADSDEIAVRWVPVSDIPFERMWPDARYWLPHVLAGTLRFPIFWYDEDNVTVTAFEGIDE